MEISGLEPRRSDLARGILIARSATPLDATRQQELWAALSAAGVTEAPDEDTDDEPDRQWHAAPWLPPALAEVDPQRIALEATAERFGIDAVWCVKVETGIDGVAWLELAAELIARECPGQRLINATEGGARIQGFEERTLAEVLEALPERDITPQAIAEAAAAATARPTREELRT